MDGYRRLFHSGTDMKRVREQSYQEKNVPGRENNKCKRSLLGVRACVSNE